MSLPTALNLLLGTVALYPVATAAMWIAGGLLFKLFDEDRGLEYDELDDDELPGVTVLIPAYNEEAVIAVGVKAALESHYPRFEVIVLDDGSKDRTSEVATEAAAGDPRCRVLRDPINRGKADQLNVGFAQAEHEYVVVTDADSHLHPHALRHLVCVMKSSPLLAAVAGGAHVTNRTGIIPAMQVLEAAAIMGLIRRTQSLTGRVGTVAGVLGMFHRDRVIEVGGYNARMSTEDIDLSWRLLLAGYHTAYQPKALVGMQVPANLKALWAQRRRWARGQGEVIRVHMRSVFRLKHYKMWLLGFESMASLIWVNLLALAMILSVLNVFFGHDLGRFAFSMAWGVAISIVATVQLLVALFLRYPYDRWDLRSMILGVIYPLAFWTVSAAAALREQITAFVRGPRARRVVWDIPREKID